MEMLTTKEMLSKYSTWVAGLLAAIASYWFQLTPAEQAALQAQFPILVKVTPLLGFVAWYIARGVKQGGNS